MLVQIEKPDFRFAYRLGAQHICQEGSLGLSGALLEASGASPEPIVTRECRKDLRAFGAREDIPGQSDSAVPSLFGLLGLVEPLVALVKR